VAAATVDPAGLRSGKLIAAQPWGTVMKLRSLSGAAAVVLLVAAGSAAAITNDENNANLPFNFSNPGARSLAMGGAFLGAADDATAAYTNPAGLTRIGLEQQVGIELRRVDHRVPYPSGGSVSILPFDLSGVRYATARETVDEVAFVSWVLPRDRWALALYRHQMLDYRNAYATAPIAFAQLPGAEIFGFRASAELEIVNYGVSFAYNLSDALSLGLGLSYYDFDIDTLTERFPSGETSPINRQTQRGDDTDVGYSFGLLYRGSDRFSIGLSYRSAPRFTYQARNVFLGGAAPVQTADFRTAFKAPDTFGIGFSWRPSDRLMLNLDLNRINYSNLSDPVDDAFGGTGPDELQLLRQIRAASVFEPRLGGEYVFDQMRFPLSLRAGVWKEKLHKLSFVGDPDSANFADPLSTYAEAVLFSAGDDETHVSAGFGLAFPRFQLDVGYDHSDVRRTLSLSGVFRF
jgi:long-chain fatty acid transport protein